MTAHPNRSKRPDASGANPSPEEIRATRDALGLTQRAAAALIYGTVRAWEDWEAGTRRMHPTSWELFRMRAAVPEDVEIALREADRVIARAKR